jgi:hypothetical protein
MSQFVKEYKQFFESPPGKYYLDFLHKQIQSEHELAEDNPMLARDHTQRAKGIRVAIEHVQSVTAKRKGQEEDVED